MANCADARPQECEMPLGEGGGSVTTENVNTEDQGSPAAASAQERGPYIAPFLRHLDLLGTGGKVPSESEFLSGGTTLGPS